MTWFSFQNVYYTNCTDINQQIPANHDLSTDAIDWLHLIFTDHGISLPQLPPQAARLALLWPYQSCQHCSGGKIPNINVGCKFKRMASLWQSSFRLCCTARSMQKKFLIKRAPKEGLSKKMSTTAIYSGGNFSLSDIYFMIILLMEQS